MCVSALRVCFDIGLVLEQVLSHGPPCELQVQSQTAQQPQGKGNFSVPVVSPKVPGTILTGFPWVSDLSLNHSL